MCNVRHTSCGTNLAGDTTMRDPQSDAPLPWILGWHERQGWWIFWNLKFLKIWKVRKRMRRWGWKGEVHRLHLGNVPGGGECPIVAQSHHNGAFEVMSIRHQPLHITQAICDDSHQLSPQPRGTSYVSCQSVLSSSLPMHIIKDSLHSGAFQQICKKRQVWQACLCYFFLPNCANFWFLDTEHLCNC